MIKPTPFEFNPIPINMEMFRVRIEAGAWEVVERVGDSVGFVIFTGENAEARAQTYCHLISGGNDELDLGDLF